MYNFEGYLWSEFQLELLLQTAPKWAQLGPNPKTRRAETKTSHPERAEECSYYRLCENFQQPFGAATGGSLDPVWTPKRFFV